jgi:hypothetical protein
MAFQDSETFIRKVGDAIQKRLPNVRTMVWNKGNAGVEASDALADEITRIVRWLLPPTDIEAAVLPAPCVTA